MALQIAFLKIKSVPSKLFLVLIHNVLYVPLLDKGDYHLKTAAHVPNLLLILFIVTYGDLFQFYPVIVIKFFLQQILVQHGYIDGSKSHARPFTQNLFEMVETQFHAKITVLRNNGLEFDMRDSFASKGSLHQLSCVKKPQQNGVVERKHQHILNTARALRFQSNLPLSFWADSAYLCLSQ